MSVKTAIAAVLKAMRRARGLSQNNLAEVSSRTYVSKLERAQSSPALEMMTTLSAPLNISPLTLVAITIGTETKQPISSLIKLVEDEIADLAQAGVLSELNIPFELSPSVVKPSNPLKARRPAKPAQQTEFCFAD